MSGNHLKLSLKRAPTLTISGTPVTSATQSTAYAGFTVTSAGGAGSKVYTDRDGTLPAGLSINGTTGVVSGTPSGSGTSSTIVIRVTDAIGRTADLTGFTITVAGAGAKAIAATSISIGAWTKQFRGHVPLSNIMVPSGNEVPVSWAIGTASSGTDGHWTKISAGTTEASGNASTPYPSSTGDSAELSSGTYVFPVTATYADASTDTKNLTITIVADAASMGHYDDFDKTSIIGAGTVAAWEAQNANPKSLLISTGVNHTGVRKGGLGGFTFSSQVRVRHADTSRPSVFTVWETSGCSFCKIESVVLTGNSNGLSANGLHYYSGCSDMVLQDCGVNAGVLSNSGQIFYALAFVNTNSRFTVNNFDAKYVRGGIYENTTSVTTDMTFNNCAVRYFSDNGVFVCNGTNWTFNDLLTASPVRYPSDGVHIDHFQVGDTPTTIRCTNLVLNRYVAIDADGDAYSGGLFNPRGTITVNGYIYLGRGNQGMTIAGSEGTCDLKNFTMIKGYGVNINTDPTTGVDDSVYTSQDPSIVLRNSDTGWTTGTTTFSSGIVQDLISYITAAGGTGSKPASVAMGATVHALGVGGGGQPSSAFNTYFNADPRTAYNAKTDAQWKAMNTADLIAFAITTATPKSGVTDGALTSAGAWNT